MFRQGEKDCEKRMVSDLLSNLTTVAGAGDFCPHKAKPVLAVITTQRARPLNPGTLEKLTLGLD